MEKIVGKVIIMKTGETAEEADIKAMGDIDLMNYLAKAKSLLEDRGLTQEALDLDKMMWNVRKVA
jgi:hypothetical protein